jgi:outer membrane protein OmpA-like peptidoglycan-associated protein
MVLQNVLFETNKWKLNLPYYPELDSIARIMNENTAAKIELYAHTDSRGNDINNLILSQKRANAVRAYLNSKGIVFSRIFAMGYGETMPFASNESDIGMEANRRIEFKILNR